MGSIESLELFLTDVAFPVKVVPHPKQVIAPGAGKELEASLLNGSSPP